MNPMDIVRLTPKTNCGRCGYPGCLAFSVAVARGGGDPALCPYLEKGSVTRSSSLASTDLDELSVKASEEHDLALVKQLQNKISDLDFAEIAEHLGARVISTLPETLSFVYLGQNVELCKTGVLLDKNLPADHRDIILLYNYVHSEGGRRPDGNWLGMESLPNSISKIRTLATYCEKRLAQAFSGVPSERLVAVCGRLQGVAGPVELGSSATLNCVIPVLPMVPQYLLFWDSDLEEGFEARVKVLFDHNVLDFLDIESLVFSAERLADRLLGFL